ncbi:MAG: hypothetical protein JSW62_03120 [Thermoplasmatales archaeon]|nr:MAG: hypothetical protein JSW62_03120 [Thermoplasmatales archaeon]
MKKNLFAVFTIMLFLGLIFVPANTNLKAYETTNFESKIKIYSEPIVPYKFFFVEIDASFANNAESWMNKKILYLRFWFEPDSVMDTSNYLKLDPLSGEELNYPIRNQEWPVQIFDIIVPIFFGSAEDDNGRITINGRGILVTALVEWHKHHP